MASSFSERKIGPIHKTMTAVAGRVTDAGWNSVNWFLDRDDVTMVWTHQNSTMQISALAISGCAIDLGIDLLTITVCGNQRHFLLHRLADQAGCHRLADQMVKNVEEYNEIVALFFAQKDHTTVLKAFAEVQVEQKFSVLFCHAPEHSTTKINSVIEHTVTIADDCTDGLTISNNDVITVERCYALTSHRRREMDLGNGTVLIYINMTDERVLSDYPDNLRREMHISRGGVKMTHSGMNKHNPILHVQYLNVRKSRYWTFLCDTKRENIVTATGNTICSVHKGHPIDVLNVEHLRKIPPGAWIEMEYKSKHYAFKLAVGTGETQTQADKYMCCHKDKRKSELVLRERGELNLTQTNSPAFFIMAQRV